MKELEKKRFIITGASKGLGEIVSKEFSKYSMDLVLIGRNTKELQKVKEECSKNSSIELLPLDLLDIKKVEEKITNISNKYKRIDGIIHIAGGGYGFREPLLEYEKFLTLLNLNLLSITQINNILIPNMIKNDGGNIIHIGSVAGVEAVASVGYNTAKAALNAYVRSLGNEFAKDNIIITGVNPGGFLAPKNAMERLRETNIEAYEEFINKKLPRKQMGRAEELLDIIKLLSTNRAGMFCGNMIKADAGEGNSY